jgi:hypothetical protein
MYWGMYSAKCWEIEMGLGLPMERLRGWCLVM